MHPIIKKMESLKEELLKENIDFLTIRVFMKEFLQYNTLNALYSDNYSKQMIFYGGTCLRKLYGLNRMSEDLDFESTHSLDLTNIEAILLQYFSSIKLDNVNSKIQNDDKTSRITLKFEILNMLDLSLNEKEKLHIKIEINDKITNEIGVIYTPIMNEGFSLIAKHYDISTLCAQKMAGCVERFFLKGKSGIEFKGRDFYDLIWFMQKQVKPNPKKLEEYGYNEESIMLALDEKVNKITYEGLIVDLDVFFRNKQFIKEWAKHFHDFYNQYRKNY
ncbi:MAG: hypothetical protein GF335_01170 [Candidatus Moranbacteria bacterium]|nr:hypothetical protein [Candidatus Moranbacteria bacterium]